MASGTSIADVYDWLVTSFRSAVAAAVTTYNTESGATITGEVWEEWPLVDSPLLVVVGRRTPDDEGGFEIPADYDLLGARRRTERPSIPWIIQAGVGGNRSVRDARRMAVLVYDGLVLAVKNAPSVNGRIVGGVLKVDQVRYQGPRNDEDAANGRSVMLTGVLSYEHQYIPS